MARNDKVYAADYCRAALARGPLHKYHLGGQGPTHWRYERRLFSARTIRMMIFHGEAKRVGDTVIATDKLR